jgi:uncharacterized protein DUF4382
MKSILKAGLLGAFVLFMLASCGNGGTIVAGQGAGQVAVSLTDDNDCGLSNVFVTVVKARVNMSATALNTDPGWIDIIPPGGPFLVDLLSLQNGSLQDLGLASLPSGHYNQIRFFLAQNTGAVPASNDNNFVVISGTPFPLDVPAGFQSGIKVLKPFDVSDNQKTEIIADFDACNSVSETASGSFILRPRILALLKSESGGITGTVDRPLAFAVAKAEVKGADGNFFVVRQTLVNPVTGSFTLFPLLNSTDLNGALPSSNGTYEVVIVSSVTSTSVTTGVAVAAGSTTVISDSVNRTPLASSLGNIEAVNVDIDPTSADARIRQSVNGKTYQVRRHPVRLFDGKTSFLLALGSPTFAPFGILPITYSTDAALTLGSLTVDTPSDDGLYADATPQSIPVLNGSTQTMTFTGADVPPLVGTAGTANGNITVNAAPLFPVTIVLSVRTLDSNENVNSTSVTPNAALTVFPYVIDDLAPGSYTLDIVFSNGLNTISPARSVPITVTSGGTVTNSFQLSP